MKRAVGIQNYLLLRDIWWSNFQWKGITRKQSAGWQHLSKLKASAFFSLQKKFSCYETQQLILGTSAAIWWVTEPHYIFKSQMFFNGKEQRGAERSGSERCGAEPVSYTHLTLPTIYSV